MNPPVAEPAAAEAIPAPIRRARMFCPMITNGYDQASAKTIVPFGVSLHKAPKENRWRAKGLGDTASKSYGKGTGLTDYAAMVVVILETWKWHQAVGGDGCPYTFTEIPGLPVAVGDAASASAPSSG